MTGKIIITEDYQGKHKECPQCHLILELDKFQLNRGKYHGMCKPCQKLRRQLNKDKTNATSYAWRKLNREKTREYNQRYRAKNRDKYLKWASEHEAKVKGKNPHAKNAHAKLYQAIKKGLVKKDQCAVCEKLYNLPVAAVAHHCDYNKPLDVQWLCKPHHQAWHRIFTPEAFNER